MLKAEYSVIFITLLSRISIEMLHSPNIKFSSMNRQQILDSVQEEHQILKHLFAKIKPEHLAYAPGEKMRTTEELLRYITYCAVATTNWYDVILSGRNKENAFQQYVDRAAKMDIQEFPAALDRQHKEMEEILSKYTDEDLMHKKVNRIAGNEYPFNEAIVTSCLKYLTAYRMQLFLYVKQAGQPDLNTYNCWVGKDAPPKKPT